MNFILTYAPLTGLLFFFTLFLFLAYRTYRPAAKRQFQEHGRIPLREDHHE